MESYFKETMVSSCFINCGIVLGLNSFPNPFYLFLLNECNKKSSFP